MRKELYRIALSNVVLLLAESVRATETLARQHGAAVLTLPGEGDFLERIIKATTVREEPASKDFADVCPVFKRAGESAYVDCVSESRFKELLGCFDAILMSPAGDLEERDAVNSPTPNATRPVNVPGLFRVPLRPNQWGLKRYILRHYR